MAGNCTSSAILCMQFLTELASLILDQSSVHNRPMMNNSVAQALMATFHSYGNEGPPPYVPPNNIPKYGTQKVGASPKYNNYPSMIGQNFNGIDSMTLTQESFQPYLAPRTLRLYSMKYCPYAQRLVIYLAKKNIPVDVVNINPERPPNWFLAKNPIGQLPALEINGKIVIESTILVEYLDDAYPESSILPSDPLKKAEQKMLLQNLEGFISVLNQLVQSPNPNSIRVTDNELHTELKNAENLLTDSFYGGRNVGYADIMIWPFLERLELITLSPYTQFKYFPGVMYPKMGSYIARMQRHPEIKFASKPLLSHKGFIDSMTNGRPNYDYPVMG